MGRRDDGADVSIYPIHPLYGTACTQTTAHFARGVRELLSMAKDARGKLKVCWVLLWRTRACLTGSSHLRTSCVSPSTTRPPPETHTYIHTYKDPTVVLDIVSRMAKDKDPEIQVRCDLICLCVISAHVMNLGGGCVLT